MAIHLVNPSDNSFGTAVITPRWLFVLANVTPRSMGDPILVDESLEPLDPATIRAGDVVGISIHTGNALRGYAVGSWLGNAGASHLASSTEAISAHEWFHGADPRRRAKRHCT